MFASKNNFIITFSLTAIICSMCYLTKKSNEKRVKRFLHFNQSNVEGTIENIEASGGYFHLSLENADEKFAFTAITNKKNGNISFLQLAEKGTKFSNRLFQRK